MPKYHMSQKGNYKEFKIFRMKVQLIKICRTKQKPCLKGTSYHWAHVLEKKKYLALTT